MSEKQYNIAKWVLSLGADPRKFADRVNADYMEMLAVKASDNFTTFKEMTRKGSGYDVDAMMKMMGL